MTGLLWLLVLLPLFLNGWMYLQQPSMIFFPYKTLGSTPSDWGMAYEDVNLQTADGVRLHGWYIPREGASRTLLFLHGNAGNISHRGDSVQIFHRLGLNVFILDYRGYGNSGGKPGEEGLYEDARSAWRHLVEMRGIPGKDIVIFGRSLGGVVATRLASEVQAGALIVESAFSSARDVANHLFPLLSRVIVMRFDFNAAEYISRVSVPVLVAHSPDDEVIPIAMGQKLYQAANAPRQFMTMKGDHNSGFLFSQPAYEQQLQEFLNNP